MFPAGSCVFGFSEMISNDIRCNLAEMIVHSKKDSCDNIATLYQNFQGQINTSALLIGKLSASDLLRSKQNMQELANIT